MFIIPEDEQDCYRLSHLLTSDYLPISRFTSQIEIGRWRYCGRRLVLKVRMMRLKRKKDYCGQHPNACVVSPFAGLKKHKVTSYLEGSDFVAFNDMLNDMCDKYGVTADIWSTSMEFKGKLFLRKGKCRRVYYPSMEESNGVRRFYHWDVTSYTEMFEDWIGKEAPRSGYPEGTPGIPEWRMCEEAKYKELFV